MPKALEWGADSISPKVNSNFASSERCRDGPRRRLVLLGLAAFRRVLIDRVLRSGVLDVSVTTSQGFQPR